MKSHKFANIFPLMNKREYKELKIDIKENGLLEPITTFEEKILDGRNRYNVCKELNIKPKLENYKGDNALQFVISTNLKRRHLTESQRAMIAIEHRKMFDEEARKRMQMGKARVPDPESIGQARDKLGETFSVGGRIIDMAEEIKEKAPEKIEAIEKGKEKVSTIYRELKIKKQKEQIEKLVPENEISGIYDIIVIDPPWDYGTENAYDKDSFRGTAPYPIMSIEKLKNLKLPTTKNCVLWLWTTNTFIHEAYHLLESWGFEPKSILTWDKQHFGTGRWLRSQTEHCILAIKGKPYWNNKKYSTLISEMKTTHSTKPESFYRMVEDICVGRKLDYFGRKKRKGWDVFGVIK